MGHDHHGPPYTIPPASCFQVGNIKELKELEKALAIKGLKDPWIRNEAWRYHPGFGTRASRARTFFMRGMPLGLALAVATVAFDKMTSDGDHHGDHGEHH